MIRALPIVVGYCPGSHAQEALSWAVRESGHLGLPLVVLFAADYPGMATAPGPRMPALDPGALDAAHEVTARGVLDAQQRDRRITVHGRTLVTSATRSLIEASPQASMIVVGSRGRGPVLGAMLGSVSRSVPARAHCPVVVVPPGTAAKVVGPECRVTVGTDGSRVSMLAVDHAAAIAASRSAPLDVICCTGGASPIPLTSDQAHGILSRVEQDMSRSHPDLQLTTRMVPSSPQAALIEASEESGLVVVGSRGRGALEQVILGSVSASVIRDASSPVGVVGAPRPGTTHS